MQHKSGGTSIIKVERMLERRSPWTINPPVWLMAVALTDSLFGNHKEREREKKHSHLYFVTPGQRDSVIFCRIVNIQRRRSYKDKQKYSFISM